MNYSRSLINHIVKLIIIITVFSLSSAAQHDTISSSEAPDTIFVMTKSPWVSVALSAAVPGLGQIYSGSYWKAPVIWGIGAWLVYNWIDLNDNYKSNRSLYLETGQELYRQRREFYRDERDLFSIYLVLTYILNLVDAYVDAHLYDFTVEEDLMTGHRLSLRLYLP